MAEIGELSIHTTIPNTAPGETYATNTRSWQGIPGIERANNGRLWAVWYSGGTTEGPENYVVLITSADDGRTWSAPRVVIDPPDKVRAYDPTLWHDPQGHLWLFWAQSYDFFDGRAGVWAIHTDDATVEHPIWSSPVRVANGVMMNKPTVLSTGEWLLPTAVWSHMDPKREDMQGERYSNVTCSTDAGATWVRRGGADVPTRHFDEHMIVERRDGSLWILVRTNDGIGEAISNDRGFTWEQCRPTAFAGPCSRFFIRRLQSGTLLLVNHHEFTGRNKLTAMLSNDDGKTWQGYLVLDERNDVSYPDGVQADDGRIYIIYDRERYAAKEILMAVFTEEDVLASRPISTAARLKVVVNKIG